MNKPKVQIAESIEHNKTAHGEQSEFNFDTHDILWGFYHAQRDMLQDGVIDLDDFWDNLATFFTELEVKFSE